MFFGKRLLSTKIEYIGLAIFSFQTQNLKILYAILVTRAICMVNSERFNSPLSPLHLYQNR